MLVEGSDETTITKETLMQNVSYAKNLTNVFRTEFAQHADKIHETPIFSQR